MVVGLKEYAVDSVEFLKQLIEESGQRRSTGSTAANADSSRSHSIMQFALKAGGPDGRLIGKISFIDLAGSERGADTFDNNRQTRLEGAEINKRCGVWRGRQWVLRVTCKRIVAGGSSQTANRLLYSSQANRPSVLLIATYWLLAAALHVCAVCWH